MANVRLINIDKTFNKNKVLSGLNLEVPDGSFMVMVGPSGCGKSTALRCIAGLEEVTGGSIYIGDADVTSKDPKDRNIALEIQNNSEFSVKVLQLPRRRTEDGKQV